MATPPKADAPPPVEKPVEKTTTPEPPKPARQAKVEGPSTLDAAGQAGGGLQPPVENIPGGLSAF